MKIVLFLLIAYVLGSLPNGVWIGKYFKNIDIREHGSNNSGATNAYRILGPRYGLMVLVLDALKGFLPPFIALHFGITGNYLILIGLFAIIGHTLSFFLNFRGGKGVLNSLCDMERWRREIERHGEMEERDRVTWRDGGER